MRADVRHARPLRTLMHHLSHHPLVDAIALRSKKERIRRPCTDQTGASVLKPASDGLLGRHAERHHALLVAFARDLHRTVVKGHVMHVKSDQFGDTDARGVQHFQHCRIT